MRAFCGVCQSALCGKSRRYLLLLLLIMVFTLTSCAEVPVPSVEKVNVPNITIEDAEVSEPTPEPTPEPTLEPTPKPTISVNNVTLDEVSLSLNVGETKQMNATIDPSNPTDSTIIWASSDEKIVSISDSGLITASSLGTTDITVKSNDVGKSASCKVTVRYPISGSFDYNKVPSKVIEGTSIDINALDSTTIELISSNNDSIAIIDGNIVNFIKPGKVKIEVKYTLENGDTKVKVKKITVKRNESKEDSNNSASNGDNNNNNNNDENASAGDNEWKRKLGVPEKLWKIKTHRWKGVTQTDGQIYWCDDRGNLYDGKGNFLYNLDNPPWANGGPVDPSPAPNPAPTPEPEPTPEPLPGDGWE